MDRSHRRWIWLLLAGIVLCLLVASGLGAAAATSASVEDTSPKASFGNVESESFEADRTRFLITVYKNGGAEWTFRYEQRLETDEDLEDFETYAERFNTEETESYSNFRTRARSLTETGTNVTDRQMSAETFHREARVEARSPAGEEFAVVEMSFVWDGFAELNDDRVVVGDVFVDGLYVGPEQELRFERGPELRFDPDSVTPDPDSIAGDNLSDSETITWIGEHQFTDRHPRIAYIDRELVPESSDADAGDDAAASDPNSSSGTDSFMPIAAIIFVVLLGSGVAVAYRTGVLSVPTGWGDSASTDTNADSRTEAERAATRTTSADTIGTIDSSGMQPAISDEELLSDEERVVSLLEERGGRMKQVEIVRNTDWSKSKVSMLLSEMDEEGTISKLRVGRENIVSLAGHEPDAAGSPFDDDY